MLFAVYNLDKPFSHGLRAVTREAHLKYVADAGKAVRIAGPLLSDDGEKMIGSLLVLEMASLEAARDWADNDPYARAGLFEISDVRPWRWSIAEGVPRQD